MKQEDRELMASSAKDDPCGQVERAGERKALLSQQRRQAWVTRRAKYGQRGHAGSYDRSPSGVGGRALALVMLLHRQAVLSEGQCCKALGVDRVTFRIMRDEHDASEPQPQDQQVLGASSREGQ